MASRELLGGQPLRPNSNITGYLAQPPLVLTTLEAAGTLLKSTVLASNPISAVRVRVSNVEHFDDMTRERIRLVAEQIALATGLDVDITIGSSPAAQTVALPAGKFGRPVLKLAENWSLKGVAVAITQAVDRKSALLFALILAVCVLFLGNALMAGVRSRQRELAVLACLGWPHRVIGSYGMPAHRRRWGRPRTVVGVALRNGLRLRGRSAVGILAMAFGVAALTLVAALQWAFHGQVTGTLLGDAVSVRARGVDAVAVLTTLLLGVAAVGDVIYLNMRDRAAELAALRACGWTELTIGRLVAYEGVLIGLIGSALGAGAGLYGMHRFLGGEVPTQLVWATLAAGGIGVALAALASVVPAVAARSRHMHDLLAEE